jgi:hypothetical protein
MQTRAGSGAGSGIDAGLGAGEACVLAVMGARGGWDGDALAVATGLHRGTLAAALMSLELGGKVTMDFVGRYTASIAADGRRVGVTVPLQRGRRRVRGGVVGAAVDAHREGRGHAAR